MIIDWIFNLVNLSDFAPGDPWVPRRWVHKLTNFDIFLLSILLQNSATATPWFQDWKKWVDLIISHHIIYHVSLFPQENLGHLPIQHHQRHLPAPAPIVGLPRLPHPLQPPARGACGGRSGGHQPRFWARRSTHRKRHLDGSPPRRPMETWRFRNHAPEVSVCFFSKSLVFFLIWLQLSPFFVQDSFFGTCATRISTKKPSLSNISNRLLFFTATIIIHHYHLQGHVSPFIHVSSRPSSQELFVPPEGWRNC